MPGKATRSSPSCGSATLKAVWIRRIRLTLTDGALLLFSVYAYLARSTLFMNTSVDPGLSSALVNRELQVLIYAALATPRGAGAPCKRPWVLRSSSISGQWIPYPAPATRQFARCTGVACSSRGYQTKGTVMVRPSKRSTLMASSVTRTSLTRSPALGSKVVIPCLQ